LLASDNVRRRKDGTATHQEEDAPPVRTLKRQAPARGRHAAMVIQLTAL
jgi:hypothetical protein